MVPLAGHNLCSASEDETDPGPVIESVSVDLESFRTNPWNIFGVQLNLVDLEEDAHRDVSADINIHSFGGSMITDSPFSLGNAHGMNYRQELLTFAFNPELINNNHTGLFADAQITLRDNTFIDAYDSTAGYSPSESENISANLYSNGRVVMMDNSVVLGNAYCPEFSTTGAAYLTGAYFQTDTVWNNLTGNVATLQEITSCTNSNTTLNNCDSFIDGSLILKDLEHMTLNEGIYHFETIRLSEASRLDITGKVILFCSGNVDISDDAAINFMGLPGDLAIFSFSGNINVTGSTNVYAQLYAVNGTIALSDQAEVFGRLFARSITLSGEARLHFDIYRAGYLLHFATTRLDKSDSPPLITVFALNTLSITQWRIDVLKSPSDNHAHFNVYFKINGQWSPIGEKIGLKGIGDYDLFCKLHAFNKIIEYVEDESLFANMLLDYRVYVGGQWHIGQLNFWRSWAYSWDNSDEIPDSQIPGKRDNYDQPWEYKDTLNGTHIYDLRYAQSCNGLTDWECYWTRSERIQYDALRTGVILQMDLFDLAMPQTTDWQYNPFNPDNQFDPNELDSESFTYDDFYLSYDGTNNYDTLREQQESTVEMIVNDMKHSGVTFFRIANEPRINTSGPDLAIAFFDGIEQKAYSTFCTPINDKAYLMATMVYNLDPFTYQGHQAAIQALLSGVAQPGRFKIIDYHTPYWYFSDCSERIDNLKTWHDSTFSSKVIIVDTDGASESCRDGYRYFPPSATMEPNVYCYAYTSYDNSFSRDSADFNVKYPFWVQPNDPFNEGAYLDIDLMKRYHIDRAYNYWW